MKTKTKLWLLVSLGLVVLVVALVGAKISQFKKMGEMGKTFVMPPESVTSAKVEAAEWENARDAIGTLVAVRGVTLGSEVAGLIRQVTFDSGAAVKKGDLLVKLDTSAEEAQLQAAKADAALAKLSLDRARNLRAEESNSPADLDAAEARAKAADAAVANLEAVIAKKSIRAPFDGRISIRSVELGQVLSAGSPVASLQSVSPIYADFWLPQQALAQLKAGQRTRMRCDAYPGASWEGVVQAINPEVDAATRNVRVRATFPNGDGRLKPGMFANVQVLAPEKRKVLVIPATAPIFAPYGDSVFAIEDGKGMDGKPAHTVKQRAVRLGERRTSSWRRRRRTDGRRQQ
jgi:membrane fusion protein (multidrug efflux system)